MTKQDREAARWWPRTTLVIDRSKWLRGSEDGKLLDENGRMCCLGFFALACGYRPANIDQMSDPSDVFSHLKEEEQTTLWPTWLLDINNGRADSSSECNKLIRVNDSRTLGELDRELEITKAFARYGVAVTFVDGPEAPAPQAPKESP